MTSPDNGLVPSFQVYEMGVSESVSELVTSIANMIGLGSDKKKVISLQCTKDYQFDLRNIFLFVFELINMEL